MDEPIRHLVSSEFSIAACVGRFNPNVDFLKPRIRSAKFKEISKSTELKKAQMIKKENFNNLPICVKLISVHNNAKIKKNRAQYSQSYSQLRQIMKHAREKAIRQAGNNTLRTQSSGRKDTEKLAQASIKFSSALGDLQSKESHSPFRGRISQCHVIAGGPNLHIIDEINKRTGTR